MLGLIELQQFLLRVEIGIEALGELLQRGRALGLADQRGLARQRGGALEAGAPCRGGELVERVLQPLARHAQIGTVLAINTGQIPLGQYPQLQPLDPATGQGQMGECESVAKQGRSGRRHGRERALGRRGK
jgi:hypothetical protein